MIRYTIIEDVNNRGAWGVWDKKEHTLVRDEKYSRIMAANMTDKLNKKENASKIKKPLVFTQKEVQHIIQNIYTEFAELDRSRYYPYELKRIIETEVEKHPTKPISIFVHFVH
jgi:hypothetical protein